MPFCAARLTTSLLFATTLVGSAAPAAGQGVCSAAIANESCTLTIDRDAPSSPLPMKMKSSAVVTLVVKKRPLDGIVLDVTVADAVSPDPLAVILGAFMPALNKLVFKLSTVGGADRTIPFNEVWSTTLPDTRFNPMIKRLAWIHERQLQVEPQLRSAKDAIDISARDLKDFSDITTSGWESKDFTTEQQKIVATLRLGVSRPTPSGLILGLREALALAFEDYAKLPPPISPAERSQYDDIGNLLNQVNANQALLDAGSQTLQAAIVTLTQAASTIERIQPKRALQFSRTFGPNVAEVGRTATVKINAQDALSKTSSPLATAVLVWNSSPWELSTGAAFSWLANRSFQNTPVIVDGKPVLDSANKVETIVTETISRPSVVPFVLTHYVIKEGNAGGRRLAFLGSFGMGINPGSGSADLGGGLSIGYRAVVFSGLLHWGRDLRLTNGIQPGQKLGSSPPALTTERYWKKEPRGGVAITLRLPL